MFSLRKFHSSFLCKASDLPKINRLILFLYFINRNETFIVTVIKYINLVVFGDNESDIRGRDVRL